MLVLKQDSNDGDKEDRELNYVSDIGNNESEVTNLESVVEEKALRKLLNYDEESNSDSNETI